MKNILPVLLSVLRVAFSDLSPIIFVPGLAGNGLVAHGADVRLDDCPDTHRDFNATRLWLPLQFASPPLRRCWLALMSLHLDPDSQKFRNTRGVTITPYAEDVTRGVEILDYWRGVKVSARYYDMIKALVANGYERDVTLFGFAYDWRLPPWQVDLPRLKALIEKVVLTRQKKALIVTHSLGSLILTYFFNSDVDADWKAKHIESFISINGANAGSTETVSALLSGHFDRAAVILNRGVKWWAVHPTVIRDFSRGIPSLASLVPHPKVYDDATPIVLLKAAVRGRTAFFTPASKKRYPLAYSVANWTSLLPDEIRERIDLSASILGDLAISDPGVPTYCIWSNLRTRPSTTVTFTYLNAELMDAPQQKMGDGDGIMCLPQLRLCNDWVSNVRSAEFSDQEHVGLLRHSEFIRYFVSLVMEKNVSDGPLKSK